MTEHRTDEWTPEALDRLHAMVAAEPVRNLVAEPDHDELTVHVTMFGGNLDGTPAEVELSIGQTRAAVVALLDALRAVHPAFHTMTVRTLAR